MTKTKNRDSLSSQRRAISPILATVVLLGIAVVGGGLAFAVFSSGINTASTQNVIAIENAQAVKGTGHADVTATVKNAGGKPWTEVQMTVAKTELSEPILYESLHENVVGCKTGTGLGFDTSTGKCKGVGNGGNEGEPAGGRDNPLRAQWIVSLDKSAVGSTNTRTDGEADKGEGAAVGRKLVFQSKDDLRTVQILPNTAISELFNSTATYGGNIEAADQVCRTLGTAWKDCSATFTALDPSTKGEVFCRTVPTDSDVTAECKVFTHTNIKDDPIAAGESVYFYADAFTRSIPGLNNQILQVGDNVVVNVATEDTDGGSARVQTIIKVSGS